jgi:hypothetical protein
MNLIYDVDLVFAGLGSEANLLYQLADIVYRVIRRSIQLVDVE